MPVPCELCKDWSHSTCENVPDQAKLLHGCVQNALMYSMKERGQVVLLGDFNARVGKSSELDDVIGMFGEGKCNASGNRLISFLNEVELVVCNGREFTVEPQWTRARPSLKQKSIIDYIVTDSNLLQVSGSVQVDTVDIGKSDHFLVWMELGRTVKTTKQQKRVIKKWRIERFQDEEV